MEKERESQTEAQNLERARSDWRTVKVDCFARNLTHIGLFHLPDLASVSPNRRQLAKGLITNM